MIPQEYIQEVVRRNDIEEVVGQYVKLRRTGRTMTGLCPFHNEKTPSFVVYPDTQSFYCFGCGAAGDVIGFVRKYNNLGYVESVKQLASRAGMPLPEESDHEATARQRLLEINRCAARYFYENLNAQTEEAALARRYWKEKRGLSDAAIRRFGLGYAPDEGFGLVNYLKRRGFRDDELEHSGLIRRSERGNLYTIFRHRVMVPIIDVRGAIIAFGGRVLDDSKPKYINSPETMVYHKSRTLFALNIAKKSKAKRYILCEGYMDVISMHQAGFTNAVASLGTALTEEQCRLLRRYVGEILLTYDSDGAGIKAAKRAMPMLRAVGIQSKVISMKPYKDPDEFIKAKGQEAFQERIDQAQNSFLWLIDVMKLDYDLKDPAGMTAYTNAAAEKLSEIQEAIERENYIQAVAREQMIDVNALRRLVNTMGEQRARRNSPLNEKMYQSTSFMPRTNPKKKVETALQKSEKQLVTWLSEKPELIPMVQKYIQPADISDETVRTVLELVYQQQPVNTILDRFREDEEAYEKVAAMFNGNLLPEDVDEREFKRGLEDVIRNVKMSSLNTKIANETDPRQLSELFQQQSALQGLHID